MCTYVYIYIYVRVCSVCVVYNHVGQWSPYRLSVERLQPNLCKIQCRICRIDLAKSRGPADRVIDVSNTRKSFMRTIQREVRVTDGTKWFGLSGNSTRRPVKTDVPPSGFTEFARFVRTR